MMISCGTNKGSSIIVTHSNDSELSDQRFIYVLAQNYIQTSKRDIVTSINGSYPSLNTSFDWITTTFIEKITPNSENQIDILPLQSKLEQKQINLIQQWEESNFTVEELTKACEENTNEIVNENWQLASYLIAKHSDGYINPKLSKPTKPKNKSAIGIGYPSDRLKTTKYKKGSVKYDIYKSQDLKTLNKQTKITTMKVN